MIETIACNPHRTANVNTPRVQTTRNVRERTRTTLHRRESKTFSNRRRTHLLFIASASATERAPSGHTRGRRQLEKYAIGEVYKQGKIRERRCWSRRERVYVNPHRHCRVNRTQEGRIRALKVSITVTLSPFRLRLSGGIRHRSLLSGYDIRAYMPAASDPSNAICLVSSSYSNLPYGLPLRQSKAHATSFTSIQVRQPETTAGALDASMKATVYATRLAGRLPPCLRR